MLVFSLPALDVLNTTLPQESEDCKTFPTCGLLYLASLPIRSRKLSKWMGLSEINR